MINNLIFVAIAAYCDPDLARTIRSCIDNATNPDCLSFGICWQHDADETIDFTLIGPRIRVLDVPWSLSRGTCWARAEAMKLWDGESHYLQLDSHCRMSRNWDRRLIECLNSCPSPKPLISTYATPFEPADDEALVPGPLQIDCYKFDDNGIPMLRPSLIKNWHKRKLPVRGRFLAGGFIFCRSSFITDVPYDPEVYFHGEEPLMSLRAFTHGYDIFHPIDTVVWHHYYRSGSRKHWTDHVFESDIKKNWKELDKRSKDKVVKILSGLQDGHFGLGSERSLLDFEKYVGIAFSRRRIHLSTIQGNEPPATVNADWLETQRVWNISIYVDRLAFPLQEHTHTAFLYVGFHDSLGREIYRLDASPEELAPHCDAVDGFTLERTFESDSTPVRWTIWPFNASRGWGKATTKAMQNDNFVGPTKYLNSPVLGVYIASHNSPMFLRQCLLQISFQTRLPNVIAIRENGHRNSYKSIVRDVLSRLLEKGVVTIWSHTEEVESIPKCFYTPLTELIAMGCQYIIKIDDDDFIYDRHLEAMLTLVDGGKEFALNKFSALAVVDDGHLSRYSPSEDFSAWNPAGAQPNNIIFNLRVADVFLAELVENSMAPDDVTFAAKVLPKFSGVSVCQEPTTCYVCHGRNTSTPHWIAAPPI